MHPLLLAKATELLEEIRARGLTVRGVVQASDGCNVVYLLVEAPEEEAGEAEAA